MICVICFCNFMNVWGHILLVVLQMLSSIILIVQYITTVIFLSHVQTVMDMDCFYNQSSQSIPCNSFISGSSAAQAHINRIK